MGFLDRLQQAGSPRHAVPGQATVTESAYEIWGQRGRPSVDVVGESFHAAAIRAILGAGKLPENGRELRTEVHLVPTLTFTTETRSKCMAKPVCSGT